MITSGCRPTNSFANIRIRSTLPAAKRTSMRRVNRRTVSPSRRTINRYPSCLISCTQPGPAGGLKARDGMQGQRSLGEGCGASPCDQWVSGRPGVAVAGPTRLRVVVVKII
jgi:hypothetical protein